MTFIFLSRSEKPENVFFIAIIWSRCVELWFYWCAFEFWKKWKLPPWQLLENKIAPKSTACIWRNSLLTQLSAQAGRINRQSLAPWDASFHGPTLQAPALLGIQDSPSNCAVSILSISAVQAEIKDLWNDTTLGLFVCSDGQRIMLPTWTLSTWFLDHWLRLLSVPNVRFWELVYLTSLFTIPVYARCVCECENKDRTLSSITISICFVLVNYGVWYKIAIIKSYLLGPCSFVFL